MFSTVSASSSRPAQGYSKNYAPHVPKGFSVRVFKGPSTSSYSFPQTTSAKLDRGYQSIPLAEPRQSTATQTWHSREPRPQTYSNTPSGSAPSEPPKTTRPQASTGAPSNDNRLSKYDPNSRPPPPSYSIYQDSKNTYIYEASLSSKGDLYSNSGDDDATTTDYTPSSAFSPAMSTDSITTLRGAFTPDMSLTDLRSISAPTSSSSRTPFPLHIPSLSQAQTAIKGMFRSQTPNNQPPADESQAARSASTRMAAPDAMQRNTPFRTSETVSASDERRSEGVPHGAYASSNDNSHLPHSRSRTLSNAEDGELDDVARANTAYNAAASRSRSASTAYYSSARDSMHLPATSLGPMGRGTGDATGRLYPNIPLRSSPEQQHAQATTPHWGAQEVTARENGQQDRAPYRYAPSDTEDSVSSQHEQYAPSPGDWSSNQERSQPPLRPPPGGQPASTTQVPRAQNNGNNNGRYVPASRTMLSDGQPGSLHSTSPEPLESRGRDGVATVHPPSEMDIQRERRTPTPHVSPTLSIPRVPAPREPGGAAPNQPGIPGDGPRRGSAEHQTSYPSSEQHHSTREPPSHRTLPQQSQHPSTRYATTQPPNSDPAPTSRYITSNSTRPSNTTFPETPVLRASPEQTHRLPSAQPLPQSREHAPSSASRGAASNYPATQGASTSPSRVRRDSIAGPASSPPRPPSNINSSTTPAATQNHILDQHMNPPRRQSSIYETQHTPLDTTHNQRGSQYSSHPEDRQSHRSFVDPYNHTSGERQHNQESLSYMQQRNYAANAEHPSRTRYEGDRQPVLDSHIPHQPFPPPSTVSSDPGPDTDHRGLSYAKQQATQYPRVASEDGRRLNPLSSTSAYQTLPQQVARGPDRSQTPFPAPLRDPQRRYSDGDSSVAGDTMYAPAYADGRGTTPGSTAPIGSQPQRRYSDSDQVDSTNVQQRTSLTLFRTVRWNENLVCPSPIFPYQRRKGWFNRRGDQLWTNDGAYKPPQAGQEYPPDLDSYPEHGDGWMNEQGVRIDMGHRLIPKTPLKSALKANRTAVQLQN